MTERSGILALARELDLPEPVMEPLARAADGLPELPVLGLADPETAGGAWEAEAARIPGWHEDDGMAQLAVSLAAACRTREVYRENGISDGIFLATMGCFRRFLLETHALFGRWAYDRGFWTWRQTGCRLFRLGALEFEYYTETPEETLPGPLPPDAVFLSVHIPSDASLTREALDGSYATAERFFHGPGRRFCYRGAPSAAICGSWLLAPALDGLLSESSGIRRFAGDYKRYAADENDVEFYRWLFQSPTPLPAEELPEDTSLRRAAKSRLLAGGKIGMACGILDGKISF